MSVQALRSVCARALGSGRAVSLVLICGLASAVFQLLHLWLVMVGMSGTRTIALVFGLALAGILTVSWSTRLHSGRVQPGLLACCGWNLLLQLAVLALLFAAPTLWSWTCDGSVAIDPTGRWLPPLLTAVWMLIPAGALCGCGLIQQLQAQSEVGQSRLLLAAAIWIGLLVYGVAPWVSLVNLAWGTLIVIGLAAVVVWRFPIAAIAIDEASSAVAASTAGAPGAQTGLDRLRAATTAAVCGGLMCAAMALSRELMPVPVESVYAMLIGSLCGWPLARLIQSRTPSRSWMVAGTVMWLLAVTLPAVLFPELIRSVLFLNAHLTQGWFVLLLRGGWFAAQAALLVGGLCLSMAGQMEAATPGAIVFRRSALPAVFGFAVVSLWLGVGQSLGTVIVALTLLSLGVQATTFLRIERSDANRARLAGGVAFGVVAMASLAMYQRLAPVQATRLLFSTQVLQASLRGEDADALGVLDEGRAVVERQTADGSLTVWKYRGVQYAIHRAGIPESVFSFDSRICPQYSGELLPTLLGLSLHQNPQRVCLLGLGSGVPVQTALAFPVRDVECVEPSQAKLELLTRAVWSAQQESPLEDDRLTLRVAELQTVVDRSDESFDVMVLTSGQSGLASTTSQWTRESLTHCARQLSADGLMCVRFRQLDYGPDPLRIAIRTLQSVFDQTAIFEVASGEVVLIGTNSDQGLLRQGLVERLQRPHVQHVLGSVGWDWVKLLQLPWYGHEQLQSIAGSGAAHTVQTGAFSFTLGRELLRWGPKSQELEAVLGPARGSLLEHVSQQHKLAGEIQSRLNELRAQVNLMQNYPDEPWAYRKKLKEFLQTQPRTTVQQVSGGDSATRHPVDRQRMGYLAGLSRAASSRSASDIRQLTTFEYPSDPLLSFFMHREIAELYESSDDRDVVTEFRHRLHAIYFADPADRSVRDVSEAIQLLAEFPEAVEDPQARRDHLDALLQMLKVRWDRRNAQPPNSPDIAMNDIEVSLQAARLGMRLMAQLTAELDLSAHHWSRREQYLERHLTRPLRTYRARLLPHHQKELYKRNKTDSEGDNA